MKPLLISSGEPAGIGPDLCVLLAEYETPELVILADSNLLQERAELLKKKISLHDYEKGKPIINKRGHLTVLNLSCAKKAVPGLCEIENVSYVLTMLSKGANLCLAGEFSALVTAPVSKAIINEAGFYFTGHTEFFEDLCKAKSVMLLTSKDFNMAFVTTHLPLKKVAALITEEALYKQAKIAIKGLKQDFGIIKPLVYVAGLNPHAGENGHLGDEEIKALRPAIKRLQEEGYEVKGPLSADTLFTLKTKADLYLMMYHDQGLPVFKYASFGSSANVTLGLPLVRTSVDHGTALELAGTGKISSSSLLEAILVAEKIVKNREHHAKN